MGYELVQKKIRGKKKRGGGDFTAYFLQAFGRKPMRDTDAWTCKKGKQEHRNFPEKKRLRKQNILS